MCNINNKKDLQTIVNKAHEVQCQIANDYVKAQNAGDKAQNNIFSPWIAGFNLCFGDLSALANIINIDSISGIYDAASLANNVSSVATHGAHQESNREKLESAREVANALRELFAEIEEQITVYCMGEESISLSDEQTVEIRRKARRRLDNYAHIGRATQLYGKRPSWLGRTKI